MAINANTVRKEYSNLSKDDKKSTLKKLLEIFVPYKAEIGEIISSIDTDVLSEQNLIDIYKNTSEIISEVKNKENKEKLNKSLDNMALTYKKILKIRELEKKDPDNNEDIDALLDTI